MSDLFIYLLKGYTTVCPTTNDSKVTLVGGHGAANPGVVVADLGVDSRLVPLGTAITPGHHALQLTIAHHGATGISLTGRRRKGQHVSRGDLKCFCVHFKRQWRWPLLVPGRSPCLPRGSQHRTCWRWSVQGRRTCSCCRSGWGHPGTSGDQGSSLKKKKTITVSCTKNTSQLHLQSFTDFQSCWCCPIQRSDSGCQRWHSWRAGTRCGRSCSGWRACSAWSAWCHCPGCRCCSGGDGWP